MTSRRAARLGAIALGGLAAGAALARPRDRGAPHAPPFDALNTELRRSGPGRPVLLLDLDALDANVAEVRRSLARGLELRLVAKSLPSVPLLRYLMAAFGTDRLMVFDHSVATLHAELPAADLMMGKPLPVRAVAAFYDRRRREGAGPDPGSRVRWLVDDADRLAQLAVLARELGVRARVAIEIDVGLHRGGLTGLDQLGGLLAAISADPEHLGFAGLMGYEPHVASAPRGVSSVEGALGAAVSRYAAFRDRVRAHDPSWLIGDVVFDGAGSRTYALHHGRGPIDEIALGSCLVMPGGFDVPTLAAHRAAVFIATPVLKRLAGTTLPYLERVSPAWPWWDPNRALTFFVFGGGWLARPVSPAGLLDNPVFGFSTNQAMLNGSRSTALEADDWVFFRPTQSERVMQELGDLQLVRGGRLLDETWPALGFAP